MTKLAIPGSWDARGSATFRTSIAFLRQPIFEPLSDVLIASRQMNPRLVMLLRELASFSSIRPSVRMRAKIRRSHRYRGHSIRSAEDRCNIRLQVRIIGAVFGFFRLVTPKARRVFREAGTGIEDVLCIL